MEEIKVIGLEQEIEKLKEKDEMLQAQVRELQEVLGEIVEKGSVLGNLEPNFDEGKIKYLTEVNEQMFQQIKRLRQLIEKCIESEEVPTHEEYSRALQG